MQIKIKCNTYLLQKRSARFLEVWRSVRLGPLAINSFANPQHEPVFPFLLYVRLTSPRRKCHFDNQTHMEYRGWSGYRIYGRICYRSDGKYLPIVIDKTPETPGVSDFSSINRWDTFGGNCCSRLPFRNSQRPAFHRTTKNSLTALFRKHEAIND